MLLTFFLSAVTLLVSSQQDYDRLPQTLESTLLRNPAEVKVVFEPGTYLFRDEHIFLYGRNCPGTDLSFEGNGAVLKGTAYPCTSTVVRRMGRPVEVVDEAAKRCRIRTDERLPGKGRLYVQITSWYRVFTAPVEDVKRHYLYFTVSHLEREGLFYNINGDITYGMQLPRFRLIRVQDPDGPISTGVFKFTDCAFRSLTISGFCFDSNASGQTGYGKDCLVRFEQNRFGKAVIQNCTFRNLQTDAVRIAYTDSVEVRDCRFEDCARTGVLSYNHSAYTRVTGCTFERMDLALTNGSCVNCSGKDYLISGNRFVDYGPIAIKVGLHYTETMTYPSSGIVENNEIYQSDAYREEASMNLLMDSGAIYVATQNVSLEIRGNRIHDIDGPYDNRGIFCDDGTVNTYIHDNEILRIRNSYCIDLRRKLNVETLPGSRIHKVNVGNRLERNKVDGRVRYEKR